MWPLWIDYGRYVFVKRLCDGTSIGIYILYEKHDRGAVDVQLLWEKLQLLKKRLEIIEDFFWMESN